MNILLAEDEVDMSRAITAILKHEGYEVTQAFDGVEAVEAAAQNTYDCMVMDIMMPRMDGIEALTKIRAGGDVTPVIMLTAKSEIDDRIGGLDAGADDYLTKPFAMKELLARIRSMVRRSSSFTPKVLNYGSVELNTVEQEIKSENSIRLSKQESALMELFLLSPGKEFTTQQIFQKIWKDDPESGEGVVWVYISYLRQKLKAINADVTIAGDKGGSFALTKE
ncbi:MAG: response regulator transcription factor [Eubacterium sp.]|nr:response regulator transcription factor [Eubacterium sp.]